MNLKNDGDHFKRQPAPVRRQISDLCKEEGWDRERGSTR